MNTMTNNDGVGVSELVAAEPAKATEAGAKSDADLKADAAFEAALKAVPAPDGKGPGAQRVGLGGVFGWETMAPWEQPVDGAWLLGQLSEVLRRYVVLPEGAAEALALWVMHTYACELRSVCVYVGIESPQKRCGKTTLLEVLGRLVCRPLAAANISPPALYRAIAEGQPTLLIDEADTFVSGNDELRGVLNAGYKRDSAFVVRVDPSAGEGGGRLTRFSCYCPKAVAGIGFLPETLADRCIVVRMQRKLPGDECERLGNERWPTLRRQCLRWVRDNEAAIRAARPELPRALNDRAADIWEPLLALAELCGDFCAAEARRVACRLSGVSEDQPGIGLFAVDLASFLNSVRGDRILSRVIVGALSANRRRPWAELTGGRELDERALAGILRRYGIEPRTLRVGDAVGRGYFRDDFAGFLARYVPEGVVRSLTDEESYHLTFSGVEPVPRPPMGVMKT